MAVQFEEIEHEGVTYFWSGWQAHRDPERTELVACWQTRTAKGLAQCDVMATRQESEIRKEQLKENALNSIRDLVETSREPASTTGGRE